MPPPPPIPPTLRMSIFAQRITYGEGDGTIHGYGHDRLKPEERDLRCGRTIGARHYGNVYFGVPGRLRSYPRRESGRCCGGVLAEIRESEGRWESLMRNCEQWQSSTDRLVMDFQEKCIRFTAITHGQRSGPASINDFMAPSDPEGTPLRASAKLETPRKRTRSELSASSRPRDGSCED